MHHPKNRQATANAPGKLILIGEHSVVHGTPAIAIPFPLVQAMSTIQTSNVGTNEPVKIQCKFYVGPLKAAPPELRGIERCIYETVNVLKKEPKGFDIVLESTIPVGRGLGSSAAVAVALVKSLFAYFDEKLSQETLLKLVHLSETYAHGKPSGIDMEAIVFERPIWFQKGETTELLKVAVPISLVIADTGRVGDTFEAVQSIANKKQTNPTITRSSFEWIQTLVHKVKEALEIGDNRLLGFAMNEAQKELAMLGVSDEGLQSLIDTSLDRGAIGAKLTGGGRGGCIIVLTRDKEHAKQIAITLKNNGAYETWSYQLDQNV